MAGVLGLHAVSGRCDLCGDTCDSETQELNVLSCTFAPNCPDDASCYHQECLEKYLKNIRCEKNRKTGFKCPRGCGKGSQYPDPCPGKIDKSHPIHVRNDNAKKRKKAKMPEPAPEAAPRFGPAAKAARAKEAKEREEEKARAKAKEKERAAAAAKAASAAAPKAKAAAVKKESLLSAAAAARRELGLPVPGPSANGAMKAVSRTAPASSAASSGLRTYEELLALRSSQTATPAQPAPAKSVWGSSSSLATTSKPASPSPPPVSSAEMFPPMPAATKPPPAQVSWGTTLQKSSSSVSEESTSRTSLGQGTAVASRLGSAAAPTNVPGASQPEDLPKLSKASRKNMRRAERKREKEAEASVTSEPSPPLTPHQTPNLAAVPSPAASPAKSSQAEPGCQVAEPPAAALPQLSLNGDVFEHCLQIVAMYKMRQASLQLQRIGFSEWQAAVAVQLCGCNLHPAVVWLLEGHISTKAQAQQLMQRTALPNVDVSEEAQRLTAAARLPGVSEAAICTEVERCQGNVPAALAVLAPGWAATTAAAPSNGARQRHQRTFSPLPAAPIFSSPAVAPPLKSLPGKLANGTRRDSLDPLLDAVLPREVVSGGISSRAAAHQQPRSSAIGGSFLTAGPLFASMPVQPQAVAGSDSHSRVSSFDMLSVGNPWGDLLPHGDQGAEPQQSSPKHFASQPEPRNGFSSVLPQLPTPFGGLGFSQLGDTTSPGLSPASRRSPGHVHHPSSSSFFGSPASFTATSSALGTHPSSALGLEQYASALSSQPSWASTSSNLWGPPTQQDASTSLGLGQLSQHQTFQQQQQQALHQFADVPAAALLAAAAVASEPEGEHANGSGMALGDSELNALMATLMCR